MIQLYLNFLFPRKIIITALSIIFFFFVVSKNDVSKSTIIYTLTLIAILASHYINISHTIDTFLSLLRCSLILVNQVSSALSKNTWKFSKIFFSQIVQRILVQVLFFFFLKKSVFAYEIFELVMKTFIISDGIGNHRNENFKFS